MVSSVGKQLELAGDCDRPSGVCTSEDAGRLCTYRGIAERAAFGFKPVGVIALGTVVCARYIVRSWVVRVGLGASWAVNSGNRG